MLYRWGVSADGDRTIRRGVCAERCGPQHEAKGGNDGATQPIGGVWRRKCTEDDNDVAWTRGRAWQRGAGRCAADGHRLQQQNKLRAEVRLWDRLLKSGEFMYISIISAVDIFISTHGRRLWCDSHL